jgi:hypothetical protein
VSDLTAPGESADPQAPVDTGAYDTRADAGEQGEFARTERLLLDELTQRLDAVKLLRADDDQHADAILEQFGAKGKVESDMLDQLAVQPPLAHPDRFEEAHRTAMRALEVFDRNSARAPSNLPAPGFLRPIASFVVQTLVRMIVRDYERSVIEHVRKLYARREANSTKGSREFMMLRLARLQANRLAPDFQKSGGGLPTFLVGGAVLSGVASAFQGVLASALHNQVLLVVVAVAFALLALGAFWCVFHAAAIARRRTHIALDQPILALWETIGAAGNPPRDQSRQFATYAVILLLLAWIVVPVAIATWVLRY